MQLTWGTCNLLPPLSGRVTGRARPIAAGRCANLIPA